MRCAKAVTPIKIDANRKNAKRSTGPQSERGKSIARFNAVTLGLFAKHVVIPICDGYKPERDFNSLLDGLYSRRGSTQAGKRQLDGKRTRISNRPRKRRCLPRLPIGRANATPCAEARWKNHSMFLSR